ncbi:MAG TPA: hypothetical protein VFO60_09395, partial [Candidatus Dormibacteraeota bacterium]|nr:hypothetical protein [Candidatus Dormibacteraeota bacterium]
IYDHTQASLRYHSVECRDHPYGSRWYTWPGLAHPVLFYDDTSSFTSQHGVAEVGFIENLGNPALWWLAIPALLFCAWSMTRGSTRLRVAALALLAVSLAILILVFHSLEKPAVTAPSGNDAVTYTVPIHGGSELLAAEALVALAGAVVVGWGAVAHRFVPAFIVLSFLVAWLMWMPGNEERVLFLYHMLGALPFVALGLAYALTAMRGHVVAAGTRYAFSLRPFAWAGLAVVLAAFLFFYQIWTGAPVSQSDHQMRMWFDSWFDGWS